MELRKVLSQITSRLQRDSKPNHDNITGGSLTVPSLRNDSKIYDESSSSFRLGCVQTMGGDTTSVQHMHKCISQK